MVRKGLELLTSLLNMFLVERLEAARWDDRQRQIEEWLQE
jgi:hypothetical protein